MVFIDVEKNYNRVLRKLIGWIFNWKNVPQYYTIKDIFEGFLTSVRSIYEGSSLFAAIVDCKGLVLRSDISYLGNG